MFSRSLPIVVLAIWFLPGVTSQTTSATCLPFYSWTSNSQKQSPCEVASRLLAVCGGGSYNVDALPDQTHYLGPTLALANPCQCNTVVYSLMSACGACQGRTYDSWSAWSGNCATVSIDSFPQPIPPKTFVPGWAYFDVKANDMFDEQAAKENANKTESTAAPSPTSTTSMIVPTTSSTPITTSTSSPSATNTASSDTGTLSPVSDARANAIAGGVIGGVVGLALILALAFWYYNRRRRIAESGVQLSSPIEETHPPQTLTADMRQYLANTVPAQLASSSVNTSLASPTSAQFSNSSGPESIRSVGRSNV